MSPRQRPAMLLPALAVNLLIASGTFLVARRTVAEFPALPLALFRFLLASALLWPTVRMLRPEKRIAPADRRAVVLLGLLAVPLNQGLFLLGMQWASASHAALLYALTPALMVVLLAARGATRPSTAQVAGIVVAFAGVVLLLLQRGLRFDAHALRGDLIVSLAVVAWAAYLLPGPTLTRRYGPMVVTAEALVAGTLIYLPIGLVSLFWFHPGSVTPTGWAGLIYLAWLTSAVNYVLWFWGLEYLKPTTVSMLTNLQPLVTAAMAWVLLGERLPPVFLLSAAMVIGGAWLTRVGPSEAAPLVHSEPR